MKLALENLEASENAQEEQSSAQRKVQQKIDEAKAVAKRRETFLLNHSLYGTLDESKAPMGSTYWEEDSSTGDKSESGKVESMSEVVSASMVHMLPSEKRGKEAARLRKENKNLLKGAKNIDLDVQDVFKEQHKSSVAKLLNSIDVTEDKEMRKIDKEGQKREKDSKSRKDKCVIS